MIETYLGALARLVWFTVGFGGFIVCAALLELSFMERNRPQHPAPLAPHLLVGGSLTALVVTGFYVSTAPHIRTVAVAAGVVGLSYVAAVIVVRHVLSVTTDGGLVAKEGT